MVEERFVVLTFLFEKLMNSADTKIIDFNYDL